MPTFAARFAVLLCLASAMLCSVSSTVTAQPNNSLSVPTLSKQLTIFDPTLNTSPAMRARVEDAGAGDVWNPLYTAPQFPSHIEVTNSVVEPGLATPAWEKAWQWWSLLFQKDLLQAVPGKVVAFRDNQRGDDSFLARLNVNGVPIQIVDGRSISIAVTAPELWKTAPLIFNKRALANAELLGLGWGWQPQPGQARDEQERDRQVYMQKERNSIAKHSRELELPRELMVHYAFHQIFEIDRGGLSAAIYRTRVETRGKDAIGAFGTIMLQHPTGWMRNGAITWWTDGRQIVFDVLKFKHPVPSKIVTLPYTFLDGFAHSDSRQFIRFPVQDDLPSNHLLSQYLEDARIYTHFDLPIKRPRNFIAGAIDNDGPDKYKDDPFLNPNEFPPSILYSQRVTMGRKGSYRMFLCSDKASFPLGKPVPFTLILQNANAFAPAKIDDLSDLDAYRWTVTTPSGRVLHIAPKPIPEQLNATDEIKPIEHVKMPVVFNVDNSWREPGEYSIRVERALPEPQDQTSKSLVDAGYMTVLLNPAP